MPICNLASTCATNHPVVLAPAAVSRRFRQVVRSGFGSAERLTSAAQYNTSAFCHSRYNSKNTKITNCTQLQQQGRKTLRQNGARVINEDVAMGQS